MNLSRLITSKLWNIIPKNRTVMNVRPFCWNNNDDSEEFDEDLNSVLDDVIHQDILKEYNLGDFNYNQDRERVFVVQPWLKNLNEVNNTPGPELLIGETLALAQTLNWIVVDKVEFGLHSFQLREFLGPGQLDSLAEMVQKLNLSAVFVSTYQLTSRQRISMESVLGLPVYDRYNVVLRIFEKHARTKEAKLQVSLAQIPYLKARLNEDWQFENDNKHSKQRLGHQHFEKCEMILKRKQKRIKREIEKIRIHRERLRAPRLNKKKMPTIAVVGYTNCGKTSLIKALAVKNEKLNPENKLFATLDVTSHEGILANNLKCLYVDTVGFISDIPTNLVASFSATLEDAVSADLVIHVRDCSHPMALDQNKNVLQTLRSLNINTTNMIVVANKMDLVDPEEWKIWKNEENALPISATLGFGLDILLKKIEKAVMKKWGQELKKVRCKTGSEDFSWIMKNLTIVKTEVDESDENYSIMTVILSEKEIGRIQKYLH